MVHTADPTLCEVLQAIETTCLRRAARMHLMCRAVESAATRQAPAGSPLDIFEAAMHAGQQALDATQAVSKLQSALKRNGAPDVSRRLSKVSKVRRAAAHPDICLADDIAEALACPRRPPGVWQTHVAMSEGSAPTSAGDDVCEGPVDERFSVLDQFELVDAPLSLSESVPAPASLNPRAPAFSPTAPPSSTCTLPISGVETDRMTNQIVSSIAATVMPEILPKMAEELHLGVTAIGEALKGEFRAEILAMVQHKIDSAIGNLPSGASCSANTFAGGDSASDGPSASKEFDVMDSVSLDSRSAGPTEAIDGAVESSDFAVLDVRLAARTEISRVSNRRKKNLKKKAAPRSLYLAERAVFSDAGTDECLSNGTLAEDSWATSKMSVLTKCG